MTSITDQTRPSTGKIVAWIFVGLLAVGLVMSFFDKPMPSCYSLLSRHHMPAATKACRDETGAETTWQDYYVDYIQDRIN